MKKQVIAKLCFWCAVISVIGIAGKQTASAATKEQLKQKIEDKAGEKISKMYYDDFDYDGHKEAFAVTDKSENEIELWYASDNQIKYLTKNAKNSGKASQVCKVNSRKKVFIMEGYAGGSGSWSYCYYVQNSKVFQIKKAGERLTHVKGNLFAMYPSAFDSMRTRNIMEKHAWDWNGHTWKEYYVKLIGNTFVNVQSRQITQKTFTSYKNSKKYLAQIKKAGYRIGKIYYRENKVINVNLSKKVDADNTQFENVTFYVKGNKLKLQVNQKKGTNIVEKSSYGGVYNRKAYIAKAIEY